MRKFYAAIALCITLIGTLSPVVFSVSLFGNTPKINVEKNIAYASDDFIETKFQDILTVESTPAQNGYYTIQGNIRYHMTGIASAVPDGTPLNVGVGFLSAFKNGYISGALYQIMGGVLGATYREAVLFDPELRVRKIGSTTFAYEDNVDVPAPGLKDNEFGIINKNVPLVAGNYEAWFLQNNPISSDILSKRLTFTIDQGGNVTNTHIDNSTGVNQNGDTKFAFINYPEIFIDETKPREAKITGKFIYKDPAKPTPAPDNAPVNVSWMLSDPTDTGPGEKGKILYTGTVSGSGKINAEIPFEFTINNLDVGKKLEIHLEENVLTTSEGKRLRSAYVPFTAGIPVDNAAIQQQLQQQNADAAQKALDDINSAAGDSSEAGFRCWYNFRCQITVILVDLLTFIPNFIAIVTGITADFMLKISINPATYGLPGSGIESGIRDAWKIVRDFSNILFIFALFVAAFSLILNKNFMGFEPKKTVVRVIIMALLVNFSLLFCRIIIQTADLFSNIFYNKIGTTDYSNSRNTTVKTVAQLYDSLKIKSISLPLIDQSDPQNLFTDAGITQNMPGSFTAYLMVGFLIFFVLLIFIWTFASMLFIFLGRILGLWIGMILSPIAFVSWSIPFIEKDDLIGFENWLKNFIQLAFMTPIYLFFIYIVVTILNIKGFADLTNTGDAIQNGGWIFNVIRIALSVLIPLLLSCFLLIQGKKIAYKMSGKVGEMVGKVSGWATTAALGAATGGTAMLGRQTLGRAGSAMANKYASDTSVLGKGMNSLGNKMGAATFDVRNNKTMMKGFEGFTGAAGEKVDLGKRGLQEKGGFLESGDFTQIMEDRKARIADEKATKLEQEALARANNPQSRENIAKRNTERQIAANKKAKEAEEAKIALETGTQPADPAIDTIIDAEKAKIAANQTESNKLQTETMKINQEEFNEKSKINKERAAVAEELKKIGSVSITDPQYAKVVDLQNKSKELDAKEKAVTDKAIAAKAPIIARRDTLAQENDKLTQKVTKLTSLKGKTIEQAKHENEIAKMEAANSDEGKKLAEVEKKIQDAQKEVNKLSAEEKTLRSEGKIAEADALREKIADEKSKYTTRKNKQGVVIGKGKLAEELDAAKNEFNDKHDIKRVEDSLKDAEKAYKASQNTRLSGYDKVGKDLDIQLKKDEYLIQQRRKEILGAHADAMDKALITNKNIAGGFAETVGVITNGRLMGGSVNNAGNVGATAARNRARTGK